MKTNSQQQPPAALHMLFLDKVLLRGKVKVNAINGVERFNLHFIAQLQEQGVKVTLPAARSWRKDITEISDRGKLSLIELPHIFKIAWPNSVLASLLLRVRRDAYDVLLLANVGKNLMPLVQGLFRRRRFSKIVLIAHREATPLYLKLLRGLEPTIIAVNQQIADGFLNAGFSDTHTYYGETRGERFAPREKPTEKQVPFKFCVFGSLDAAWKGSDVAIRVFSSLPEEIKQHAELHLAGFASRKPDVSDPRIKVYSWIPEAQVPEFLGSMDVALFPSRDTTIMKETFSQSSVQAMLMGLPLLVSTLPILAEKVVEGGGLVFSNDAELREQMITLYQDDNLRRRLGAESRAIAEKKYCWNTRYFLERFVQPQAIPVHSNSLESRSHRC